MNIMNLYVYENRSMSNDLSKPLMLENLNVDTVQVHIPKEIDGTDMGTWAWWFVYQNAKREKYSIPMTLEGITNDEGEEEYISTVGLNHGFTGKHGTVMYAIEAIQADGSGAVTHEWHTKTYKLEIVYTLQGNQTEYDESESDIISALISRVNELITSGAEIAEIAETIENAAETAQEVIDSIPPDYSELSARVGANTIALAEKADQATTYTKAQVDQMIEDVEVETDTTLAVSGAPADAKAVGDELTGIKADLGDVTETVASNNLIDQSGIADGTTVVYANGELSGTALAFKNLFSLAESYPIDISDYSTRYTLSFEAYTEGNAGTDSTGLYVAIAYDDGTKDGGYVNNATSEYTLKTIVSSATLTKHIVGIYFTYGSNANNIWHVKNIMLNKGTSALPYEPYGSYSAKDVYARNAISEAQADLSAVSETVTGIQTSVANVDAQVASINGSLGDVTETIVSNNLIDQSAIADGTTVIYSNGELTGVSSAFKSLYPVANPFPLSLEDQTTQYTLSFEAYTDAEQGTNGNGIYVAFLYSDGTQNGKYVKNAVNTYTHYEVVSSADLTKHIVGVFFNYGTIAQNTFHIKNMMLNKGTSAQPYELYGSYSAKDIFARSALSEVQTSVDAQIGIQGIKIDDIRSAGISNFFDQSTIAEGEGITFDGVELKGTANAFRTAFPASGYIPVTLPDYSTRYTLSFEAYTDGNVGTDSNGLKIYYLYDDGTADPKPLPNSTDEYTLFTFLTSSILTKHLIGIYFGLGSIGENVWHVKNMMLNKGTTEQAYAPYYTANDQIARNNISELDVRKVDNSFFNKAFIHNGRIKFASHRGLRTSNMLYENSTASFEAAGIAKAWGCETDIRYTSDGVMVCMHDADIDRTTDGTGNVIDMTYAELQQYYLKDSEGTVSDTLKIPTFQEYLRICKTYSMVAIAEIKNVVLEDFFAMIEQEKMTESCIVISPQGRLKGARAITKTIPIMCLCDSRQEDYTTIISTMLGYGVDNVGISYERGSMLTEQIINTCHENGFFVNVWTVESASEAKTLMMSGADFITSNTLTDW